MHKIFYALAGVAAVAMAPAANAAVTINFNGGTGGLSAGETSFATFSPGSTGGVVVSPTVVIQSGSNSIGADPAVGSTGDPYLSVLNGGSTSFTFAGLTSLGLDFGSADSFNSFIVSLADGTSQTFTGEDVVAVGSADGDQSSVRTNGRLTFNALTGPAITGLTLTSGGNSLEIDNIGIVGGAVPEPATWGMMLLGFGAVGVSLRNRKRRVLQAA